MIDGPFLGFSANFNMEGALIPPPPDWVPENPEVPAISEASTYGMMLAGVGLVGLAARRRKLVRERGGPDSRAGLNDENPALCRFLLPCGFS